MRVAHETHARPRASSAALLTDNRQRAARIRSPPSELSGAGPASSKGGTLFDASPLVRATAASEMAWGALSDVSPAEKVLALLTALLKKQILF